MTKSDVAMRPWEDAATLTARGYEAERGMWWFPDGRADDHEMWRGLHSIQTYREHKRAMRAAGWVPVRMRDGSHMAGGAGFYWRAEE